MESLIQQLLLLLLSGGPGSIIVVFLAIILFLLFERRNLQIQMEKQRQQIKIKDERLAELTSDYYETNMSLTKAMDSLRVVLIEINSKIQ